MNYDEVFLKSEDPSKQEVLDYMSYYGVQIKKHRNIFYYLDASDIRDSQEFMRLTNFHGVIAYNIVHIKENPPSGSSKHAFGTLEDAYSALKYLYDIMISTKSDADF